MYRAKIGILIVACTLSCATLFADSHDEYLEEVERVHLEYDLEGAETLMAALQPYVTENPNETSRMMLARVALLVAELRRMDYETTDAEARDKRLLGRTIDDAAKVALDALADISSSSEKWRMTADVYGTMIRSKYKGNKYSGEMDKATELALELDPGNANAVVTACKRLLFAKPGQGGDVPAALDLLKRALEIDPEHERALIFRGIAYDKLGDEEQAQVDWKRALEVNPHSRLAKDNLESMDDPTD